MMKNYQEFPTEIVGIKIRQLRKDKGLTVEELAEKAGLSQSMISQMERGLTKPSLDTLWKLSLLLDVPLFAFFEDIQKESVTITRRQEQKTITLEHSNLQYKLLTPSAGNKIEFFELIIEPKQFQENALAHKGEECGVILQGKLEVSVDGKTFLLHEGDSIYFDSTLPHSFHNPGEIVTIGIWAMTAPL